MVKEEWESLKFLSDPVGFRLAQTGEQGVARV
jgi:hypothetical protein